LRRRRRIMKRRRGECGAEWSGVKWRKGQSGLE
jgi:hypothetical protein